LHLLAQTIPPQSLVHVQPVLFYLFASLVVLSAWAVVLSQNIVRMSVYLLMTLGGAAGLYFMLEAEFLAAIQLIVYAGGTLILIIFGVMLTSKNPFMHLKAAVWERALAAALGALLAALLVLASIHTPIAVPPASETAGFGYVVADIGYLLLNEYLVPFEVAAVLLLVVMIGAAYVARRRA
jgi:NADH-quinone oxidoreductase subunit J